jgi:hypothetical protein
MTKSFYQGFKVLILLSLTIVSLNSVQSQSSDKNLFEKRKNILKANLTSLAFRNYQIQAERVLSRAISASFTYANLPEGDVPLKSQVLNLLDDEDDEVASMLNSARIGYVSYIPEIRFYLGKGYGKGVYLAPFYKHSKYKIQNAEILEYERDDGSFEALVTNGDVSANTFGLLLGAQFNLGQRIVLDWWIMGPNFGTHSGKLIGTPSRHLSHNEQLILKNDLEDLNIPLSNTTIEISSNEVEMDNQGNWGGVRAGISLGVRF